MLQAGLGEPAIAGPAKAKRSGTVGEIRKAPKWPEFCALQLRKLGLLYCPCLVSGYSADQISRASICGQAARRFRQRYPAVFLAGAELRATRAGPGRPARWAAAPCTAIPV